MTFKRSAAVPLVLACAFSLGWTAPAPAQPASHQLQPVVITAARTEQPFADLLAPVTLITREDIERTQAPSLPELLARQPGLQFTRTGGPGSQTSLFARGAGSAQVLVLVDGIRLNTAIGGFAVLGGVNLDSVERIEIVRGNLSSLYGSEAIGGVVQIFTRGGGADQVALQAEGGSGQSASGSASVTRSFGNTRLSATLAGSRSVPFSSIDTAQVRPGPFAPGANADQDGNRNRSATLRLAHRFSDATDAGASVWLQRNRTDFDSTADGPDATHGETSETANWQAFARHRLDPTWTLRATLGQLQDDSDNRASVAASFNSGRFEARNRQAQVQADARLAERVTASFGYDRLDQRGASTGYDPGFGNALTSFSREVNSLWAGVTGSTVRQQVQLALRRDDYSDVGGATSGLAAYGYRLGPAWRARLQVSNAFRAPSFNDLYFPFFGNPRLAPEQSRSIETGLLYADGSWRGSVALFATRTRNLIQYSAATRQAENIARARVAGLELTLGWQAAAWRVDFNATYLDTEDEASGARLPRRAPLTANLSAFYDAGRWRVGGEVGHTNRRTSSDINTFATIGLAPYTLVRAVAQVDLTPALGLKLRLENAFDVRYELVDGYSTSGRAAFAGFEWRM